MSKPEIIYLQIGEQDDPESVDWSEATWCVDKVFSTDIEYRRPDKMQQEIRDHMNTIDVISQKLADKEAENVRLREALIRAGLNPDEDFAKECEDAGTMVNFP